MKHPNFAPFAGRPVSDYARQEKAAWQHEQMVKAHEQEKHEHWQTNPCDTLGLEPDFPVEVLEQQE